MARLRDPGRRVGGGAAARAIGGVGGRDAGPLEGLKVQAGRG